MVRVVLEPHPNADSLSVARVFGGYTVCVRTEDWAGIELGAYILHGVSHYEPPLPLTASGDEESAPAGFHPSFDVDSLRRFAHVFTEGEPVWVTEKIHGANARFCYADGRMRAGSRGTWKKYDNGNLWWKALEQYPEVIDFCVRNPEMTVYGEVYGSVQSLKYGMKPGELRRAVFDILNGTEWVDPEQVLQLAPELPWVPQVATHLPFDADRVFALAEGPSLIPGAQHFREGIVVKPLHERTQLEIGRVCLKVVSNAYLEKDRG